MSNPLFNALGGGKMPGPMGQFQQMMQQFQQFRQNFQGDPKQEVQKLLQSGKNEPATAKSAASDGAAVSGLFKIGSNRAHGEQYIQLLKGVKHESFFGRHCYDNACAAR